MWKRRIVAILALVIHIRAAVASNAVIWGSPYPTVLGRGGIKFKNSDTTTVCGATSAGAIRYNAGTFEGCNGTAWSALAGGGGGVTSITASATSMLTASSTTGAITLGSAIPGRLVLDTPGAGTAGYGSTGTMVRRYTNVVSNTATADITYADNSTTGMTVTVLRAGTYFVSTNDLHGSAAGFVGLSLNATGAELSTAIYSLPTLTRLIYNSVETAKAGQATMVLYFNVNDIIRSHSAGTASANCSASFCTFIMQRIF